MKKYLYYLYHLLVFKAYSRGKVLHFSLHFSRKIASSKLAIGWLRIATKYIIQRYLEEIYLKYLTYDRVNTNGLLQAPKILKTLSIGSYLYRVVWVGWHPTLEENPISLREVINLNPYKRDSRFTIFLNNLLETHWDNPNKSITKTQLNNLVEN